MTSVAFSNDCKYLISGSEDFTMKIWEIETGIETQTLKGHSSAVTSVACSKDD